jgi:YtkA-like
MRRLIRSSFALALLGAFAAMTVSTVAAGNYAETSIVGGGDPPPTAGEERELRLLLLQHGVTPVDHGTVEFTAWLPGSDERISVMATSAGAGEWIATVTFPAAGDWQMRVLHSVFETPPPTTFAVGASPMPAWLPATGSIVAMLLVAIALILGARRLDGGRAAPEPAGEGLRAG